MKFSNFAQHFNDQCGILQLMNDLGEAVNENPHVKMLGGGNPARIAAMETLFRKEMDKILQQDRCFENMLGNYDSPRGNRLFSDALCDYLKQQFGWTLSHRNIAITNGSQSSFGILFNLFAGQYANNQVRQLLLPICPEYIGYGDVGLTDTPLFKANRPQIELLGESSFKYRVDFDRLAIDDTISGICLSRPTNPTGNVITDNELHRLDALARQHDIPLIIDGAYGLPFPDLVFSEATPLWNDNTILCLSLSKMGLPGIRTGIVIANEDVIVKITAANAIHGLAPGRFGPTLVTDIIKSGNLSSILARHVKPYYQQRVIETIDKVDDTMGHLPMRYHKAEGAMFLWLWFDDLPISSQELYQRLKQRDVIVVPGEYFFPGFTEDWPHTQQCIRMSYAGDLATVNSAIDIIADTVDTLYNP